MVGVGLSEGGREAGLFSLVGFRAVGLEGWGWGSPEHLVGKYDVVHIRCFVCIVKNNDPSGLLANLVRMLSTLSSRSLSMRMARSTSE